MILSNELRCAGCSAVAFLIMSIPGIGSHPFGGTLQMSLDATPPPPPAASALLVKRPRFSFLRAPKLSLPNIGLASWYGAVLNGHKTASGETFDMNQMTACHRTLPFGTMVRVVDLSSHKSVIVRINDRGVLFADRIIDLSRGAAERLGIRSMGVANVRLEVLNKQQASEAAAVEMASARDAALTGVQAQETAR